MIRLLTPEDFALWKEIRLEALREHPPAFGGSYEESLEQTDEDWTRSLKLNFIFAYFDGETTVGVAGYFLNKGKKMRHRAKIFTAYVREGFRGRGVMDWLLEAIAYHARDQGVEQLHMEAGTYNDHAVRCYERNGFAIYGTEPRAIKLEDEYIDDYLMIKYL